MSIEVEICCGSYYDSLEACKGGAKRIELNTALALGGLTPSISTLNLVKQNCDLEVISMVRTRGGGFCYNKEDFYVMENECIELLKNGSDGIAFGFLNEDNSINLYQTEKLLSIIKEYNKKAVFHRAFDCVKNPYESIEKLINIGIDRILTSGLEKKAYYGMDTIRKLQHDYGKYIEIIAGSGINSENVKEIINFTGVKQIHSSCKMWIEDKTTISNNVSYSFCDYPYESFYDVVSSELVSKLISSVN